MERWLRIIWGNIRSGVTVWFGDHKTLVWTLSILSLVAFVASVVIVPILIARIRSDYFLCEDAPETWFERKHPALRILLLVGKNLLGAVLVLGGLLMLALPGQGVLTMLIGISLLNFPGKRDLELWVIRRKAIYKTVNWIRRRAGREPLQLPKETNC